MNKLQKVLQTIKLLIKKPSLINLIIDSDYKWDLYLQKNYPARQQLHSIDIEDIVPNYDSSLRFFSFLGGGSLPTDIILLKSLCSQIKNCSYFEIGTWRGESVANVADVATQCVTLNLSKQQTLNLGLSKKYVELHGYFSKVKKNVTHIFGDSLKYDFSTLAQKFDVIFIDGNHTYKYVKNDTEKVFKHLVHENSIVVWHDYAYDPERVRSEVLAGILDGMQSVKKGNLYHVSNTLCAVYINKNIESTLFEFPITPLKTFNVLLNKN